MRAPANTSSTSRSSEPGGTAASAARASATVTLDAQPVGRQPGGDQLGQRAVQLHHPLRSSPGRVLAR